MKTTKKKAPARTKRPRKPDSKRLFRFVPKNNTQKEKPLFEEESVIDFEIARYADENDSDEYEYSNDETRFSPKVYQDESNFDNRSYYRYRNMPNPRENG